MIIWSHAKGQRGGVAHAFESGAANARCSHRLPVPAELTESYADKCQPLRAEEGLVGSATQNSVTITVNCDT